MEPAIHRFSDLFAQLGLPNDPEAICDFIASHSPLDAQVRVSDAPFWSAAQAALLRESLQQDSDWAEVVDQLSEALRQSKTQSP